MTKRDVVRTITNLFGGSVPDLASFGERHKNLVIAFDVGTPARGVPVSPSSHMSKAFLVTINNPKDVFDPESIPGCVFAVWQLERGESGE